MPRQAPPAAGSAPRSFLPDFCDARVVLLVVIVAELFAVILALATADPRPDRWTQLALISLFVLWIALSSVVLLCVLRRRVAGLGTVATTVLALAVVLLLTGGFSAVALWLDAATGAPLILPPDGPAAFTLRNLAIAAIITALALRYLYLQREWRKRLEAEASARIQALQARIRPHFLFNSMNTIAALIHGEPDRAERAVEDLADLFRASLSDRGSVRLADELELTRRYLELERLRLGERLQVRWEVDEACAVAVLPALLLQPLVENAIYHGIQTLPEGGTVSIGAHRADGMLKLTISNPLPSEGPATPETPGHRMAQSNIRERLALLYGASGGLETRTDERRYTAVVTLPFEERSDEVTDHR